MEIGESTKDCETCYKNVWGQRTAKRYEQPTWRSQQEKDEHEREGS
jgi:hypothetical protein